MVARESLPEQRWSRHQRLLDKAQTSALTSTERMELIELREAADPFVIRRS